MSPKHLMLAAAALLLVAAREGTISYAPPEDVETFALPEGPGLDVVQANCAACHSLDYITTQPRGKGRAFWAESVDKMIHRYGAPVADGDKAAIVNYLADKFG